MTDAEQQRRTKEQYEGSPISLFDSKHISASVVFFYFISVLIIATIVFEVEVRRIICDASIQSSCHQPAMSTF